MGSVKRSGIHLPEAHHGRSFPTTNLAEAPNHAGITHASRLPRHAQPSMTGHDCAVRHRSLQGDIAMKTIVSALLVLSVLASIAAPASALDTKTFWEQQERQSY